MIKKLLGLVKGCLVVIGLLVVLALVFGGRSGSSSTDTGKTDAAQEQAETQPEEAEEEKADESKKKEKKEKEEAKSKKEKEEPEPEAEPEAETETEDAKTEGASRPETDISDEFKAAMDSYEAFFDEYVDFMKRYKENPSDMSMLVEMSQMLDREAKMLDEFDAWEQEDMTTAETAYYLEVHSRIYAKLAEVL